jgi:UDP-N-acetylmuramoyl-tripeptide--D-alanyl-D-alanine ligase
MNRRWNVSDFAKFLNVTFNGFDIPMPSKLVTDSRDVLNGDGFVAIQGENSDGHEYISDAISRGAKFILASKKEYIDTDKVCYILIDDLRENLYKAAKKYLENNSIIEIAVTGSMGKTTTREFIYESLAKFYNIHKPYRSYNTKLGCALTILTMKPDTDVIILEMGANHVNDIFDISSYFMPDISIITNIEACHIENFKKIENIISTKFEIISRKTKILVYNKDNINTKTKAKEINITKYDIGKNSKFYKIKNTEIISKNLNLIINFDIKNKLYENEYHVEVWGDQNVYPITFASLISDLFKLNNKFVNNNLNKIKSLEGRGEILKTNSFFVIDDSYNANPQSMISSIKTLNYLNISECLLILGEMKELGGEYIENHKQIIDYISNRYILFLIGEAWKKIKINRENLFIFDNVFDSMYLLNFYIKKVKVILVKGSHSNNLKFIIDKIKEDYKL